MSEEKYVKRVVMSKSVARKYLEDKSAVGRSITAFYRSEDDYRDLISRIEHLDVSHSKGFDHVTFLATSEVETDAITRACERLNLEYDAV